MVAIREAHLECGDRLKKIVMGKIRREKLLLAFVRNTIPRYQFLEIQ